MLVWRVTRKSHAGEPLSGEGARLYGGRWNHRGVPMVYTSQHLSLAVLEYLVNLSIAELPDDLFSIRIKIPNDLAQLEIGIGQLPTTWRTFPSPEALKDIGTDWARKAETPVLLVPSVVIPSERNCLINPKHALLPQIVVDRVEPFSLDERLLRKPKRVRKK
jgi:RES domain-containing protein